MEEHQKQRLHHGSHHIDQVDGRQADADMHSHGQRPDNAADRQQRQGFSAEFCSRVADCIAAHSFGSGPAPARIEEKILFDADKLDAAGALGTARMLLYHGAAGDPIYEVRADGQVIDGVGDAQRNYFYAYHGMIAQMAGSMLTPAGRRMAQARAQTARQLYQAIYDEAQGCHLALRQALDDAFS